MKKMVLAGPSLPITASRPGSRQIDFEYTITKCIERIFRKELKAMTKSRLKRLKKRLKAMTKSRLKRLEKAIFASHHILTREFIDKTLKH